MVAQGGGQIINVVSGAGARDPAVPADRGGWGFAYGASKATLARLAGCINVEYRDHRRPRLQCQPGLVSTEAVTATLGDGSALEQRYGPCGPGRLRRHWSGSPATPRGEAAVAQGLG